MRDRRQSWLHKKGRVGAALLLMAIATGAASSLAFHYPWHRPRQDWSNLPRIPVRRTDLKVTVTASGRVESLRKTLIECELENLQFRSQGHELNVSGSSTILSLVPDGAHVQKDDVLCRLDSSAYEELVRTQKIKVEEARAARLQAQLTLDVAELAVKEYLQGTLPQTQRDYQVRITLTESDLKRAEDRLLWASRMLEKGYVSVAQLSTEKATVQRLRTGLQLLRGEAELFDRYQAKTILTELKNAVENAQAQYKYQQMRFERHAERLEHYQEQVDLCTIKAPHGGVVIYADKENNNRGIRIEEGATVHQRQDLFYLPDLSEMEVLTQLHESIVDHIQNGQTARVAIEALPGRVLEGHITYVSRTPLWNPLSQDVKNYLGRLRLDSVPNGLLPGMSAQVEIITGRHDDALVVPPAAVAIEGGQEVCYVAGPEGIERRPVTVGSTTRDYLEVTDGLAEGEEVVLDPAEHFGSAGELDPTVEPIATPAE